MAISHYEAGGSREGTEARDRSSRAELRWHVNGSNDPEAIKAYLIANSVVPATYDNLIYRSLSWESVGNEEWEFTATYVQADRSDTEHRLDVGDYTFSFDTTGGTATRTWSRGTTAYGPAGVTVADYKGAINYDGQNVNGCEIVIPMLRFSIRKRQTLASITLAYVRTLADLTGSVNNDTFLEFDAGELLFLGASGQQGTDTDPEITYSFAASPNVTGLAIGDIEGIAKKGHQFIWAFYGYSEDASAMQTVKVPYWVMVEDVYPEADFALLGITS